MFSVEAQLSWQKVSVSSARCAWISKKWSSLTQTQQGLAALTICKSLVGLARLVVFTIVTVHIGQNLQGSWLHPHPPLPPDEIFVATRPCRPCVVPWQGSTSSTRQFRTFRQGIRRISECHQNSAIIIQKSFSSSKICQFMPFSLTTASRIYALLSPNPPGSVPKLGGG